MSRRNLLLAGAAITGALAWRAAARKRREYDFAGRTVLITGGSRGLGLLLAREFTRLGARVALCARDAAELERAVAELQPAEAAAFPCDVTDRQAVDRMLADVRARFGRIDVLVNDAGVIQVGPMETMTLDDYDEAMRIHFWAPLYTTLAVLPEMRARRDGRIVNISSIGGKLSVPHLLPYSASKFALVGLSEGLRSELAGEGVYVTTVCPGLMRTGSHKNAYFKSQNRAEYTLFSLLGANPATSMSAERAARQVVNACRYGDAEVVLSLPAQLGAAFHGLFPGATADLFGLANRMLPRPGGIGEQRATGSESETPLTRSPLTANIEAAARENNEVVAT